MSRLSELARAFAPTSLVVVSLLPFTDLVAEQLEHPRIWIPSSMTGDCNPCIVHEDSGLELAVSYMFASSGDLTITAAKQDHRLTVSPDLHPDGRLRLYRFGFDSLESDNKEMFVIPSYRTRYHYFLYRPDQLSTDSARLVVHYLGDFPMMEYDPDNGVFVVRYSNIEELGGNGSEIKYFALGYSGDATELYQVTSPWDRLPWFEDVGSWSDWTIRWAAWGQRRNGPHRRSLRAAHSEAP